MGSRIAGVRKFCRISFHTGVQHVIDFLLFIFIEHAHGVVESDRSKGDDSNDATSDVPIAVLDVNDTRPSDLLRDRRVL